MMAKSVVLPAPLGPIRPVIQPAGADNDASFTASKPPKLCDTRSTDNKGSATAGLPRWRTDGHGAAYDPIACIGNGADDTARRKGNNQHKRAAIGDQIETRGVPGDQLGAFAERLDHECAEQRPEHGADAADNWSQQRLDRYPGAVGDAGINEEEELGVEAAG